MCKCNKYPNGQPRPVGLLPGSIEFVPNESEEIKKLWRELDYLNEQVERLTQTVDSIRAELDVMEDYGMAGPPD